MSVRVGSEMLKGGSKNVSGTVPWHVVLDWNKREKWAEYQHPPLCLSWLLKQCYLLHKTPISFTIRGFTLDMWEKYITFSLSCICPGKEKPNLYKWWPIVTFYYPSIQENN